jgi:hypothetical protein|tara:strand:- start:1188 stop:1370 length:183 start_codon:yes stop_codon:yes gene_type:complete
MSKKYDTLLWYKESLTRMTQEELDKEESKRRMNGSWDNYVKTLGDTPENIIKKLGKVGNE